MPVTIAGTTGTTQPTATCTTSLVLTGSGSGTTTVQAAATASGTITVPAGTGTVAVNGLSSNIVSGTAVTASGTTIPFTGIPSWAKRITVMLNAVSTSGTSNVLIQLGTSGGFTTSGYNGAAQYGSSATGAVFSTNAAGIYIMINNSATSALSSSFNITLLDSATNTWSCAGTMGDSAGGKVYVIYFGWSVALSGALTQLRFNTVNGTDTFDAGKVNILYE